MLSTPSVKCDYTKVYEPSEDSFLMLDCLERECKYLSQKFGNNLTIVSELGVGSGIVTTFMMQHSIPNRRSLYLGLDINPWALEASITTAKDNHIDRGVYLDLIQSNLFSALRNNQIDLLIFNPPYVPSEAVPTTPGDNIDSGAWLDLALEGGEDGMEVTKLVLNQLSSILSANGVAYILFCARNRPEFIVKNMSESEEFKGWDIQLVERRRAGWEVLSVYRFARS